jgi:long-subunit acyl-CoA synthetase (AMP-forming)
MTVAYWPSEGVVPGVSPTFGSCGILVPGSEGRILRDDGSEADINEPGNFFFRAPNVCMGYFENEKATKETFVEGGWLKTGDRMRSDGVAL